MRLSLVVLFAGCWSSPTPVAPVAPPPEPPPATSRIRAPRVPSHCERAIDHVVVIMQPEIDRNPTMKDRGPMLRDAAVEGCHDTLWSEEALACYDRTFDLSSLRPCFQMLTDGQRDDFNQRITHVLGQPVP